MEQNYKERVKNLKEISTRQVAREIEGCSSWRHHAVHQDRGWLLNALEKIQNQVEKIREAQGDSVKSQAEVNALLSLFEKDRLNTLGDE